MKKNYILILFFLTLSSMIYAQTYKIQEGFETSDSTQLPSGWAKWCIGYYTDPKWNWTVRDTGLPVPGLATSLSVAHSGKRACCVSWWCGNDTLGAAHLPNCWLVTKKVHISSGDQLKFWASGGSNTYTDSIQIWVNIDSIPPFSTFKLGSIIWAHPSVYGNFTQHTYSLTPYAGLDIWIGFLYDQDISVDGFAVYLDDVAVVNPIGIQKISTNIPKEFALTQNYPNPFNPSTSFQFDLPKNETVMIDIFNIMGQKIKTLVNEYKQAGSYKVDFDGTSLASGTYLYRITAGNFVKTNKMILVK